ncbi:endospore biogenesis thiol-disulfide oxidoreductase StoA [Bacillus atrophaeus]|uniref:endospore biogenesis thiol-disulfide oxidoreductase StoA n=1 Tax=Bacillus atrophaeus TaxID=1452 RepID=UPI001BA467B2|nr:endospore biogenesis thiol-disulfide oxidoreductase StoA [Bacillus atrophaeus]QUF66834.1 TlpA family protein disulfide reductase [Bacillus atrophaeus]
MLTKRFTLIASLVMVAIFSWLPEATAEKRSVPAVFLMKTIEGDDISIPHKGQKTILHFWTSWCPPCKKELPQFQSFYEEQQAGGVQLVTVNLVNAEQNKQAVVDFIEANKLTFPVVLDSQGDLMKTYHIVTIPTSFLLNEKGEIEKTAVGPMTAEQLKEWALE